MSEVGESREPQAPACGNLGRRKGLLINPGAIGDCILTLSVARTLKDLFGLAEMDMFGHAERL